MRAQVFAGFVVPIIMVLALSWVVEDSMEDARLLSEEAERSIRSVAVRGELLKAALDAQTGERGFIITGNPAFLEPYQKGLLDFSRAAQAWRSLEAEQSPMSLDKAELLFERWLTDVGEPAIAARRQSPGRLFSHSFDALYHVVQLSNQLNGEQADSGGAILLNLDPLKQAVELGRNTDQADRWQRLLIQATDLSDKLGQLQGSPSGALRAQAYALAEQIALELRDLTHEARKASDLASDIVASEQSRLLFDEIRTLISDSIVRKEKLHTQLASEAREHMAQVKLLLLLLPVTGVGLGLVFLLLVQLDTLRSINRVRRSARNIEEGDLSARVQEERSDELGDLAKGFNRMAEKLQTAERQSSLLDGLQSMLISSDSESEAYAATARALEKLLPELSGAIYIIAPRRDFAELALPWGPLKQSTALVEGFHPNDCRALRTGRSHCASNHSVELFCAHAQEAQLGYSICIPLVTREDILGSLFVFSESGEQKAVPRHVLELATTLAARLALALSNLRLTGKLRDESLRDPLTGLFNRRYLEETFDRELARVARAGKPLAVIALDVDHFKRFNDEFGHDAGDMVLRELAGRINGVVRSGDIACRVGGEEFLLVLPEAGAEVAETIAEELRRQVEVLGLSYAGKSLGSLTISLGIAIFPRHSRLKGELLRMADDALYAGKRQGRNRAVVAANRSPQD